MLLDFTSIWFNFYSRLLAGNCTNTVSNAYENALLMPLGSVLGYSMITFAEGIWLSLENYVLIEDVDPVHLTLLRCIGVYKTFCSLINLK